VKAIELPRAEVHLGEPLVWNVRDARGTLLLSKGFIIWSEKQLEELLRRGAFVEVEEADTTASDPRSLVARGLAFPPSVFGLWEKTAEELRTMTSSPRTDGSFATQLNTFAAHILELLDCNVDIGIYRTVRQDNHEYSYYGYTHSVDTAVLCILLSRHFSWQQERMMSLVKAALTMNLTILELQGRMAAQTAPMSPRQRAEIEAHPQKTVELLKSLGVDDKDWLTAIVQHHENSDGTGYPSRCTEIGEMAIALRVCDVFMAKISPRALRQALSPQDAIRQLYREDKGGPISTAVIKEFGIYPPGDFVKLASGELAVVIQRTSNAKAPIVASITDPLGRPVTRTLRRDAGQAEFSIVEAVSDKTMLKRLLPERLYGFSMSPLPQ
jgi:HD-GYP domain-containing protein (c-di-GMP phosphodiesterase class II)